MDASKRVALVADEDEYFRLALETILIDKLGFSTIVEATSLDEALEHLARNGAISLALFELPMLSIRSAANLAAVRASFPHVQTAVVSASDRKQDVLRALEAGVHGYVPKSIGPAELTRALRLIVDGMIYVPSTIAAIAPPSQEMRSLNASPVKQPPTDSLTLRQREVLELLIQGKSNKEIAKALNLGEGTIKVHIAALFRAFGVNTRAAAAATGSQLRSRL